MKQKNQKLFSKKNNNKSKVTENYEKNSVHVIEQKETSQNNSSKIEDILNHPILKRRLPPIERRQNVENNEDEVHVENDENNNNLEEMINNNIENLKQKDEDIKDSLELDMENKNDIKQEEIQEKNTVDDAEKIIEKKNFEKITTEMGTGTPYFCDNIQDLKNEVDNKTQIIAKLSETQNNYKLKLNDLFQKLNKLLSENVEILYNEEDDDEENKKQENINELKHKLEIKRKGINSSKNQNKIYKQQYDLLTNKDKSTKNENIEKKIDKIKLENAELLKQIKTLKTQSRLDGKKLEDYSYNGKKLSDISKIANELKALETKKHEYFIKLSNNNKFINNCVKELENLEKFYNTQKTSKNYFNAKVEEDINRLKEDLAGSEEDIIKRIETDSSFIIRKMIHNEKMRENILKTPIPFKPADAKKMKLKKGNSLEPLAKLKMARNNIHSGQSRRMNIVAKNKSPLLTNINYNKDNDDFDPSKINYNDLTDFEYKDMISKKEHCYDVVSKLEKSIKEAQKMYQRRVKEIKTTVDENSQKLNAKNKENELLKQEIEDLTKILSLNVEENKINLGQTTKSKKNKNINKNINNNERELESQKEYLSPEYYTNNNNNNNTENNKTDKSDKALIPTHSNVDLTRNEILNDLKALNGQNLDKFPDLSNIEENLNINVNVSPNNEFERNKAIEDIKKKYNIKSDFDNNSLNDDLNLDDVNINDEERILKEQEVLKKEEFEERKRLMEDEDKFFKEHEKVLNIEEEGQFEPPIENNIGDNNLIQDKDDNGDNDEEKIYDKNNNKENENEENNNDENIDREKNENNNNVKNENENEDENIENNNDENNVNNLNDDNDLKKDDNINNNLDLENKNSIEDLKKENEKDNNNLEGVNGYNEENKDKKENNDDSLEQLHDDDNQEKNEDKNEEKIKKKKK